MGYAVKSCESGEAMTVPNGAKEAGVSGSGCNVIAAAGFMVGRGILCECQGSGPRLVRQFLFNN